MSVWAALADAAMCTVVMSYRLSWLSTRMVMLLAALYSTLSTLALVSLRALYTSTFAFQAVDTLLFAALLAGFSGAYCDIHIGGTATSLTLTSSSGGILLQHSR